MSLCFFKLYNQEVGIVPCTAYFAGVFVLNFAPEAHPLPSPPWTGLGRRLESAVRKAIFDFHLLDGVPKLAVALSGGKDSLTMLFLLHAIAGRGFPPFEICALHVTGDYSCGASIGIAFLNDICQQFDIPLLTKATPPLSGPIDCYTCSRRRRSLLFAMAKEAGCTTIAFGHHQDDNAQTTLMNLFHKGEFCGLLPKITMQHYGITIIRPLLYIDEKSIKAFAQYYGYQRVTCRCPAGQNSLRKKTDQCLEILSDLYPNVRANVAQASLTYGSQKASRASDSPS
jgi:tRNA(Ile)-lysidine synthase TilS/MesJ